MSKIANWIFIIAIFIIGLFILEYSLGFQLYSTTTKIISYLVSNCAIVLASSYAICYMIYCVINHITRKIVNKL